MLRHHTQPARHGGIIQISITTSSPDATRNYSVNSEIQDFFIKTSASREACDAKATELVGGGDVVPADIGLCSYTVYAGPELEYRALHGPIVESPQSVSPDYRNRLRGPYVTDLELLNTSLPSRFRPIIQTCIDAIDSILSLPMVLLHRDFGACNIIVDETTCHLVGVIDWAAEADVCPCGLNLHSLQFLSGELHLHNGWTRYEDYHTLQDTFWESFSEEVGGLSDDHLRTIKLAVALGLLLSSGFTSRLSNEPKPVPITDDEHGRYNMMSLDGFLINPLTKFDF